jgi:hypothetical protein
VRDVFPRDLLHVPWSEDEQPVEAVPADRSHPALSDRVRARCSDRGAHDTHGFGPEHRVEGGRELGIPTADQEGGAPALVLELPGQVTGLLDEPGRRGMLRAADDEHPPDLELDEERHEHGLEADCLDREEITSEHAGSGGTRCRCRSARMAVPRRMPELEQFATDPLVAPPGVLPGQPQDQVLTRGRE